jgi:hypothetical protein
MKVAKAGLLLALGMALTPATAAAADLRHGPDWQLVNDDGTLSKTGHAFEAVGALARTPLRLAASGGDDQGFSVLAGRSSRGRSGCC